MSLKSDPFVIIVTPSKEQQAFWQKRLPSYNILTEERPLGNGLGTLYAIQKLPEALTALSNNLPVALYHTAGSGSRLDPLTAIENRDKGAVRLPSPTTPNLLEATLKQTLPLLFPGRLNVFWCDQLFFPTKPLTATGHLSIFVRPTTTPHPAYGLVTYHNETYSLHTPSNHLPPGTPYTSLGSFSLSLPLLKGLLKLFSHELTAQSTKRNTDADFWIPLLNHHPRFQPLLSTLPITSPLFSLTDIGTEGTWWDFGTLSTYFHNLLKLTDDTPASLQLRQFFSLPPSAIHANSICYNCHADALQLDRCVLLDSHLDTFHGSHTLIYRNLIVKLTQRCCTIHH